MPNKNWFVKNLIDLTHPVQIFLMDKNTTLPLVWAVAMSTSKV